jgi:YVTN family beta-propeller protein
MTVISRPARRLNGSPGHSRATARSLGSRPARGVRSLAFCALVLASLPFAAAGVATATTNSTESAQQCPSGTTLADRAYSPMYGSNALEIFTTDPTLTPITTVGGLNTPGELVTTGDGRELYINDWGSSSLRVFDTCTLQYTSTIPVGSFSISTYIPANGQTANGRYLYVASTTGADISVVDTWTNTVVRRYPVPGIVNVQLSPDGTRLYALTALGLFTLNPQTGAQIAPFLSTAPYVATWMTTSLDGSKLYLADTVGDAVTVVDASTMTVIKIIQFPAGTTPIVDKVSPNGSQVWVANGSSSDGIDVISTATDSLVQVIPTNGSALYVSFSPNSAVAYVSESGVQADNAHLGLIYLLAGVLKLPPGNGDIRVLDTSNFQQVGAVVPTGPFPDDVSTAQPGVVEGG